MRRPFGWLIGFAVGALAGALTVAMLHPSVDDSAIENAHRAVPVTATVELRAERERHSLTAEVVIADPVALSPAPRSDPMVVTVSRLAPGDLVRMGDVAAEVSGIVIIALPNWVPLHRDLTVGITGQTWPPWNVCSWHAVSWPRPMTWPTSSPGMPSTSC